MARALGDFNAPIKTDSVNAGYVITPRKASLWPLESGACILSRTASLLFASIAKPLHAVAYHPLTGVRPLFLAHMCLSIPISQTFVTPLCTFGAYFLLGRAAAKSGYGIGQLHFR